MSKTPAPGSESPVEPDATLISAPEVVFATQSSLSPHERTYSGGTKPAEPNSTVVDVGSQVGPYLLVDKLGEGGMGAVYKARHLKLDKLVALKILPQHVMSRPDALSRFEREMKAVGKLQHSNVVQAHDAGEFNGVHYLSMEYVEGQDLHELVKAKGPMSVVNACKAIRQAAMGLAAAHKLGLVHRDIKPSNLFVTKQTGQIKILDMGLALLSQEEVPAALTSTGQCFGTPDYMAPEQWNDAHSCDARADLYSLGCTLFFLLVGHPPYHSGTHRSAANKMKGHVMDPVPDLVAARAAAVGWTPSSDPSSPSSTPPTNNAKRTDEGVPPTCDIPKGLDAIYRKLMSKTPEGRFASANELAEALAPFTRQSPPQSRPHAPREESRTKNDSPKRSSSDAAVASLDASPAPAIVTRSVTATLGGSSAPAFATWNETLSPDKAPADPLAATSTWKPEPNVAAAAPNQAVRPPADARPPAVPVSTQGEVMPQMLVDPRPQTDGETLDWLGLPVASAPSSLARRSVKRGSRWSPVAIGLGAVALIAMAAVYVIRVQTPQGELVIQSDFAGISVKIKSDGDEVVKDWKIVKGDDNKQLIRTGKIEIELPAELSGEFTVTPNTVTLTKGKQEIVKIERRELPPAASKTSIRPPMPHVPLAEDTSNVTGLAVDRRAAEWVLAHGGTCMMNDVETKEWVTLKTGDKLPKGAEMIAIVTGGETMKNADLENLAGLQHITRLNLVSPSIDNGAIPHGARLKSLLAFNHWQSGIRTSALTKLHELPFLSELAIGGEQVDDKWAFLDSLDSLWNLTVSGFIPGVQDFDSWAKFPQLHTVMLDTTEPVDAASVAEFQRKHPGCRIIVGYPYKSQVLGIDPVRQTILQLLPKGIEFAIFHHNQSESRRVTNDSPNLPPEGQYFYFQSVHLPRESPLTKEDLLPLANCSFDSLYAQGRNQADSLLQALPPRLAVYEYNLSDSDLTDEGLKHLHGISWLKNLVITKTRVTEGGVNEFHTRNPHCHITSDFGYIPPNWSAPKPTANQPSK